MNQKNFNLSCPIPISDYPRILLSHGGGGKLMHNLIEKMFVSAFGNKILQQRHDAAVIEKDFRRLAFTTDSYVVQPIFFPGGDIGSMAVHGTVNDLAMVGARPLYLSLGFIIEEGLLTEDLWRIVNSIKKAADQSNVQIVTGDTKVVNKGKGDGIFINTSGIGIIEHDLKINPTEVNARDVIIVNGDIGRHGIAIMAQREGLKFETEIQSDSASVSELVNKLIESGIPIDCMRDLTRGGLASALNEIASIAEHKISLDENLLPVREDVKGVCELLGFEPFYVACEGRFVVFVSEDHAQEALRIMQNHPQGKGACIIGKVEKSLKEGNGLVTMKSKIGVHRIIDMIAGEQLPRIC